MICSEGSSPPDKGKSTSQLNLQDPVETIAWGGNLPSRRRAITGGLSGLAISKPPQPPSSLGKRINRAIFNSKYKHNYLVWCASLLSYRLISPGTQASS